MNIELFLTSLAITLAVVGTALIYLRSITRRVLMELCASDAGAEFWLRTADVLALAGSLILVVLVSSNVWRNVAASAATPAAKEAT